MRSRALQRLSNLSLHGLSSRGRRTSLAKTQHVISLQYSNQLTLQHLDDHVASNHHERHFSSKSSQVSIKSSKKASEQEILDKTKEILHSIDLGSMQPQQISDAISLIYLFTNRKTIEGAEMAEELLERIIAEGRDGGNRSAQVEAKLYNAIIEAYAKSKAFHGAATAEALLGRMMERSEHNQDAQDNGFVAAAPDVVSYNSLMNVWGQSGKEDAVSKAEDLLAFLESDDTPINPDSVTYNIMMNTYANQVGEYGYAQKAEDILLLMTALQKEGNNSIHPDTMSFNIVLKAWKNSGGGVESAKRAEDILRLMIKLYKDGHYDVKPDKISFQTVVHAYMKHGKNEALSEDIVDRLEGIIKILFDESGDLPRTRGIGIGAVKKVLEGIGYIGLPNAGDRAKRILDSMIKAHKAGKSVDGPDAMAFASVLNAYFSNPKTVHTGRLMMEDMIQGKFSVLPTTYSMNNLLHHFCKEGDVASATDLFQKMTQIAREKGFDTMPDSATFNMMANMYFKSKHTDSTAKALSLLDRFEESFDAKELKELDPFVYNVIVNKLTKSRNPTLRDKSYDVLMRMLERYDKHQLEKEPETYIYNMVLSSVTKRYSAEGAQKALDLLRLMQTRVKEKQSRAVPDILSYSHVLAALSRAMNKDSAKRIVEIVETIEKEGKDGEHVAQIDSVVFETALQGLAHPEYGCGQLANLLLQKMIDLEKAKLLQIRPLCLNLVLKAQCSNRNLPRGQMVAFDAHRYLMDLVVLYEKGDISVLPTQMGFNTVLNSWARSRHWESYRKGEEICSTMERLSKSGSTNLSRDQFTNAIMLRIYANIRSKKTTNRAINFFNKINDEDLDTYTYNCMLIVLSRCKLNDKAVRARKILNDMKERGLTNIASYNTVLNACVYSDDRKQKDIYPLVMDIYNEMMTCASPDETSFELAIRACKPMINQSEDGDASHLRQFFDDACEKGLLSKHIIEELKQCLPNKETREQSIGHSLDGKMDKSWQRNAKNN